jgi:hypothetical protein
MSTKNFFVCFMFFSAVDAIGPIFILIFFFVYRHFSAISAKIPLQFPAVNNFFSTAIFELFCGIFRYLATVTVFSIGSEGTLQLCTFTWFIDQTSFRTKGFVIVFWYDRNFSSELACSRHDQLLCPLPPSPLSIYVAYERTGSGVFVYTSQCT